MLVRINDGRGGDTLVDLTFATEGVVDMRYFRSGRSFRLEGTARIKTVHVVDTLAHGPASLSVLTPLRRRSAP